LPNIHQIKTKKIGKYSKYPKSISFPFVVGLRDPTTKIIPLNIFFKTHHFTTQKRLFCLAKRLVLQGEMGTFVT